MKIPVYLRTRSGATIKRTITAIAQHEAVARGFDSVLNPQPLGSVEGMTVAVNLFLSIRASRIPCAFVETRRNNVRCIEVFRAGVIHDDKAKSRAVKTTFSNIVRR